MVRLDPFYFQYPAGPTQVYRKVKHRYTGSIAECQEEEEKTEDAGTIAVQDRLIEKADGTIWLLECKNYYGNTL